MIRFEERGRPSLLLSASAPLLAVLVALALAAVPLAAAGAPITRAFALMAEGARRFGLRLDRDFDAGNADHLHWPCRSDCVPSAALQCRRRGSALCWARSPRLQSVAGRSTPLPAVLVPIILLAAALAGAFLMLVPTLLKLKLGADEVVTTLLLNFVVLLFVQMMLEGPLKDPMGGGWPQSEPILDAGVLPPLIGRMRVHAGFLLASSRRSSSTSSSPGPSSALQDPRRRRQRGRRPLCGYRVTGVMLVGRSSFGGARRACRRVRGRGAQGLSDGRSLPGVRLCGDRGRDARRAAAALGRSVRDLHRRHLRRGRHDEPDDRACRTTSPISSSPSRFSACS